MGCGYFEKWVWIFCVEQQSSLAQKGLSNSPVNATCNPFHDNFIWISDAKFYFFQASELQIPCCLGGVIIILRIINISSQSGGRG